MDEFVRTRDPQTTRSEKPSSISRGIREYNVNKACPDANTVIITHRGGGGRASLVAHSLKQLGYTRVYAITASYDEIKKAFG